MGVEIGDREGGAGGADVDADDADALLVQVQEARPAPARGAADGAFGDPALANQLLGDRGDGAGLQPGMARQIGPGDRLVPAYQVEHDPAVDVAGRFARGYLKVGQVDL